MSTDTQQLTGQSILAGISTPATAARYGFNPATNERARTRLQR